MKFNEKYRINNPLIDAFIVNDIPMTVGDHDDHWAICLLKKYSEDQAIAAIRDLFLEPVSIEKSEFQPPELLTQFFEVRRLDA